jgi:hypothetical protein
VRQFAELKSPGKVAELRPLLLDLPDSVESIKAYLDFVLSLEEGSQYSQEPFDEAINILRRMLEYVVSNKGGYTRKTSRTWEAILNREALREKLITSDTEDAYAAGFAVEVIQMYSQTVTTLPAQKAKKSLTGFWV